MIKAQKGILNCTLIINKTFRVWFLKAYYNFYADHIQLPCSFCEPEECKLSGWLNCWATWLSPVVIRVWIPVSSRPSGTLGLLFDESMHHWRNLVKKCFFHLRNISQLKNTVSLRNVCIIISVFQFRLLLFPYCDFICTLLASSKVLYWF